MKLSYLTFTAILLLFCAGCIPIPTGEFTGEGTSIGRGISRGGLDSKNLALIHPEATTKEEVLLNLGEPDFASQNERKFVYWWSTYQGIWVIPGPHLAGGGGAILNHLYLFLVEFDEKDIVKRFELKKRTGGGELERASITDAIRDEMKAWGLSE